MLTSREYMSFARQCLVWATETHTRKARLAFIALAKDWTLAALESDRAIMQEQDKSPALCLVSQPKSPPPPNRAKPVRGGVLAD